MNVDVLGFGAIRLGTRVTCDGFVAGTEFRVQSHIHADHMDDFDTSKGHQTILLSEPTRDLLIAERNADLPYRANIEAIPFGTPVEREGLTFTLEESKHMLGAAQVVVELEDGLRCGYSGDFSWPLETVIQVDELVLDSTYGNPASIRRFSQDEAIDAFVNTLSRQIKTGPVRVKAHRGTLHRALACIFGELNYPVVADVQIMRDIDVHRKYGYGIGEVHQLGTPEAATIVAEGQYIELRRRSGYEHSSPSRLTTIILSAFYHVHGPVIEHSEYSFTVALSDHAHHDEILEYVEATGARRVVTDNTRGGNAVGLSHEIRRRLGLTAVAKPLVMSSSRPWGHG